MWQMHQPVQILNPIVLQRAKTRSSPNKNKIWMLVVWSTFDLLMGAAVEFWKTREKLPCIRNAPLKKNSIKILKNCITESSTHGVHQRYHQIVSNKNCLIFYFNNNLISSIFV